jgi:hypothetical protein
MASELDYVMLPTTVLNQVRNEWKAIKDPCGKPIWK